MCDQIHEAARGDRLDVWSALVAVSLGCAVPAGLLGKAAIAVFLIPAVLAVLVAAWRRGWADVDWGGAVGLAAAATAVAWLISSLASIDLVKSLATWARTMAMVLFGYLLVAYLADRPRSLRLCFRTLLLAEFAVLTVAVFVTYIDSTFADLVARYRAENFNAPQAFKAHGSAAACILPVALWVGWRIGGAWRLLAVLLIPLTLLILYGWGNQINDSGYFGLIGAAWLLGIVAVASILPTLGRRLLILGVAGVLLAGAAYLLAHLPEPPVTENQVPELPFPDWHRQVIWGFALAAFRDAPVIGVGPNTINYLPGAHNIIPGMNQEYIPSHPHNWVLEIAVETGALGLLLLAVALLLSLRRLAMRALGGSDAAWVAIAALAVFWVSALGNFSIWSAWWIMSLVVVISLPLAAMQQEHGFRSVGSG